MEHYYGLWSMVLGERGCGTVDERGGVRGYTVGMWWETCEGGVLWTKGGGL